MKTIITENGQVNYLNSGDWIENLTALEYNNKEWKLYKYDASDFKGSEKDADDSLVLMEHEQIFEQMLGTFLKSKDIATPINFK